MSKVIQLLCCRLGPEPAGRSAPWWNNRCSPELNVPFRPGYANEVGEAFRSMVPATVVWLSYGVSSSYVLADAIDKGQKARQVRASLPLHTAPP